MLISTQSSVLSRRLGCERTIEVLKNAGFDAIDFSSYGVNDILNDPSYKDYAKKLKKIADDNGIFFNQSHAPFPTSFFEEDKNRDIFDKIVKSLEFASILGAKNIIVHPKQHLTYVEGDNARILRDMNVKFYTSLIPYCKDLNITVCLENMYQIDKNRNVTPSTCSSIKEFKEYLDLIDSPYIAACLDTGHANMVEEDIPAFIKALGEKLVALHVHEAQGNWDFHRVPYVIGNIKWTEVINALKEINYKGNLTFEADNTLLRMPDDLLEPTAHFMAEIGKSMAKQFEN